MDNVDESAVKNMKFVASFIMLLIIQELKRNGEHAEVSGDFKGFPDWKVVFLLSAGISSEQYAGNIPFPLNPCPAAPVVHPVGLPRRHTN